MFANRQLPPSANDADIARESCQLLTRLAGRNRPLTIQVMGAGQVQPIDLPAGAVALLVEILDTMAAGRGMTLLPAQVELTTLEAAEVLSVSRPYMIKLLENGCIPFRKVGKHRRVRMEDILAYKDAIDRERESVLDRLAAEAQEQGMGYPKG